MTGKLLKFWSGCRIPQVNSVGTVLGSAGRQRRPFGRECHAADSEAWHREGAQLLRGRGLPDAHLRAVVARGRGKFSVGTDRQPIQTEMVGSPAPHFTPCSQIPNANAAVEAGANQGCAIGQKRYLFDPIRVPFGQR